MHFHRYTGIGLLEKLPNSLRGEESRAGVPNNFSFFPRFGDSPILRRTCCSSHYDGQQAQNHNAHAPISL
jgi:hypothetical protein